MDIKWLLWKEKMDKRKNIMEMSNLEKRIQITKLVLGGIGLILLAIIAIELWQMI